MTPYSLKNPGIKRPFLELLSPVQPTRYKCFQITIPDHDEWITQFYSVFQSYLGFWPYWDRDTSQSAIKIAKVWQKVGQSIKECQTIIETPDDDCETCDDIEDEETTLAIECATPFIGQVVAGITAPTSIGWLECNGLAVSKALYPELYAILQGKVTEDVENFNLPDFRDRILMGTGLIVANTLDTTGESEHTLIEGELPSHLHTIADHTHTTDNHTHDIASHAHSIPSHDHSLTPHTHPFSVPAHTHTIPGRDNSAAGSVGRFVKASSAGTQNDATETGSGGAHSGNTSLSGAALTGGGGGGNTGGSGTLGASSEPVTINPSGAGNTSTVGSDTPFSLIPPVVGILWFIFAGCNASSEGC